MSVYELVGGILVSRLLLLACVEAETTLIPTDGISESCALLLFLHLASKYERPLKDDHCSRFRQLPRVSRFLYLYLPATTQY